MKGGLCHKIFPLYGRGWAVDPPKKMTNYNEDTSSRGRISISLLWAKISDLPRRYFIRVAFLLLYFGQKYLTFPEDTSSRGRISTSLLWAKISDLPSVSVGGPLLPLVEKVKVFFSLF